MFGFCCCCCLAVFFCFVGHMQKSDVWAFWASLNWRKIRFFFFNKLYINDYGMQVCIKHRLFVRYILPRFVFLVHQIDIKLKIILSIHFFIFHLRSIQLDRSQCDSNYLFSCNWFCCFLSLSFPLLSLANHIKSMYTNTIVKIRLWIFMCSAWMSCPFA